MEPPAPDPQRVAEAFTACAEPSWGLLKQVGPPISYCARSGTWTLLTRIDFGGDLFRDAACLKAVLLDLDRAERYDLIYPEFDWNGVLYYRPGPDGGCRSRFLSGPTECRYIDRVLYGLWEAMLDQGVACPARFAVLRESALWGFMRADRGAHWGALAGDAGAPRETQLLAERVCQLLDENDGFLAA